MDLRKEDVCLGVSVRYFGSLSFEESVGSFLVTFWSTLFLLLFGVLEDVYCI